MGFSTPGSGQPHDISDDLFSNKIDVGQPMPSAESQSSEFTKMFGKVGAAAPLVQPASGVAAPPDKPLLNESPAQHDPFNVTQPLPVMKSETPVTAGQPSPGDSPSEFTMIMRGGYGQNKPAETTAAQTGSGGAGQAAGKPAAPAMPAFGGIKAPAMTPPAMATLGTAHASGGGLNASAGAAGASVGASQIPGANLRIPPPAFQMPAAPKSSSTKKLIIFLVCLGVLALVMILVVLFLLKTQ
jgi:hypothetical protein